MTNEFHSRVFEQNEEVPLMWEMFYINYRDYKELSDVTETVSVWLCCKHKIHVAVMG